MKKTLPLIILIMLFGVASIFRNLSSTSGAPPYIVEDLEPPDDPYDWLTDWKRPEGPARVGLQVGHYQNDDFPEELARLRNNDGATGGGKAEWEINLAIAEATKALLEEKGIMVDILPATITPKYFADAFVSIHADGSTDKSISGFKIASPRRDFTGKASSLVQFIEQTYSNETKLEQDPNISRNMTGYYAFAWWRYEHSIHPMTTAAILETGFLTNASDRKTIVSNPHVSAQGLAKGILAFLENQKLI